MEEQATQEATQPYYDQRRDANAIMQNEADEGDVICILHPASPPAYRAVELIAEATPQHIISREFIKKEKGQKNPGDQDSQAELQYDHSKDQRPTSLRSAGSGKEAAGVKAGAGASDTITRRDIALRLSSRLRNPCMGFVFGRGATSCDLMLTEEEDYSMRISKSHFRMFFNHLGVLMLEDVSTNGTAVNHEFLNISKNDRKRMIAGGEIIEIIVSGHGDDCMRFIVTFPLRHNADNLFAHNLAKYLAWRDQEARRAEVLARAAVDGRPQMNPPVVCRTIPFHLYKN